MLDAALMRIRSHRPGRARRGTSRTRGAVFGLLLAALPAVASGQSVSARAFLGPGSTVQAGAAFVVNLEVTGTQQFDRNPVAPELGPWAQYIGSGNSTSMRMVGGRTSVSITIQYRYQALQEGTFEIPAMDVAAGGQALQTEPLSLTVTAGAVPPQAGSGGEPDGVSGDDLFVTATPSKTRVLDGEPLVVEYRIWTRIDVTSYQMTSVPEPEGFWAEELQPGSAPQVEQIVRNGQQYASAVIRRLSLVPSGTGTRTLGPLGIEAQVRTQRRSSDPFDRIFGGSSLFGGREAVTVLSEPVTIEVLPLPAGRPEPFSGVVGSLDLVATLDRDTVMSNDAVTLTIVAAGEGNLRAVPPPELELPDDFEVFPPEVSGSVTPSGDGLAGSRTFEYVMIPRAPGNRTIPAVTMGYFDPATGEYRTATTGEVPLVVTGTLADGPASLARGGITQLREDIRFIRLGSGSLRPLRRTVFEGAAFWLFLLLPMASVAGAALLRRHRDRLEGDVAWARGRSAGRVARKRLAEAGRLAEGNDGKAFYAEVAIALRGFVADKLNMAAAGLQTATLEGTLIDRAVSDTVAREVVECLEFCDRQRFAPVSSDVGERKRFLDGAERLMTTLGREMKP